MPILSPIQKRSPGGRLLLAGMYSLLVIGSLWMVYPFLLLLSGSVKGMVDIQQFDIFPRYLYDDHMLFRKFEEQRYGGWMNYFTEVTRYHHSEGHPLESLSLLESPPSPPTAVLQDWNEFLSKARSWPRHFLQIGHAHRLGNMPPTEINLQYRHRIWTAFPHVPRDQSDVWIAGPEFWQERSYQTTQGPYAPIYEELCRSLPLRYFIPTTVEGHFIVSYLQPRYGNDALAIAKLNKKWGSRFPNLYDVAISPTPPSNAGEKEDWWAFVRNHLSTRFVQFAPSLLPTYRNFLKTKYHEVSVVNKVYVTSFQRWEEIDFPSLGASVATISDLDQFLASLPSPRGIFLDSPDFRWRNFLREKYSGDLQKLNQAHASHHDSFDHVKMPILVHDWALMKQNKGPIIREYLTRNYRIVWDYLSGQGRAFQNTIIFCILNILTALIVNPLAAYALSRFQPRWGYKVLFFLMATMAFPGEVTQIPAFLMLRDLGWLNTFAALIIPAAANGYFIFLLKGFFDSLPKDLYESATLDGASELRIFTTITMPLSSPILAVIALGAFTAAYSSFMFALLVCQKKSMWTLMVYIYQIQQLYSAPVVFAALVLAAIPTLLVFVFCQKIIMRGIVVPVEK